MSSSDTTKTSKENGDSSSTLHDNATLITTKDIVEEVKSTDTGSRTYIVIISVCAVVLFIALLVCYCMVIRCRNSGNSHRQSNESERDVLYQNSNIIKNRMMGDSLETLVNRPLPQPPVEVRESVVPPAVPEDDYLPPINSIRDRHLEEIRKLPPPPPVFPRHLERLALDGEGAYTPVIPDDEAPLLSPGPSHEIARDEQLCELREESGYVVPKSLPETSLQRSLSETDHPPELKEIKHMGSETQMRLRPVVTTPGALQQCPDMSESRSFTRDASLSSATKNKTENSKETKRKTYRSSCHLYLLSST